MNVVRRTARSVHFFAPPVAGRLIPRTLQNTPLHTVGADQESAGRCGTMPEVRLCPVDRQPKAHAGGSAAATGDRGSACVRDRGHPRRRVVREEP